MDHAPETSETSEPMRLNSAEDLLSAIPYLIGYHPADSVMCIAVQDTGAPVFANLRLASIGLDAGGNPRTAAAAAQVAAQIAAEFGIAYIVGYGTAERIDPVVLQMHRALDAAGVTVPTVLRADARRYYCLAPHCGMCPPDGTAYDPDTSLVTVHAVLSGLTALPDRETVAAQLNPVEGARRADMDAACRRASHRLQATLRHSTGAEAGIDALRNALYAAQQGRVLSDDEIGWLAVTVRLPGVQVIAWELNTADAWQRQLWTDVVRRATPALTALPACLLASTAYLAGNGPLANIAVDRALHVEPGIGFARLLQRALDLGIPPRTWQAALAAVATNPQRDQAPNGPAQHGHEDLPGGPTH